MNAVAIYGHMTKRTTVVIDEDLLARAKRALGAKTARATVEESLRRAVQSVERSCADRILNQKRYLHQLGAHANVGVLESGDMWRRRLILR